MLAILLTVASSAIYPWKGPAESDAECFVCGTVNRHGNGPDTYYYPSSYTVGRIPPPTFERNSYFYQEGYPDIPFIYTWRSLPHIYSCKNCKLTLLADDFYHILSHPDSKKHVENIKNVLAGIRKSLRPDANRELSEDEKYRVLHQLYLKYGHIIAREKLTPYFRLRIAMVRAHSLRWKGMLQKARHCFKYALKQADLLLTDPEHQKLKKEILFFKASIHYHLEEPDKAISLMKHALNLPVFLPYKAYWIEVDHDLVFEFYLDRWLEYDLTLILKPLKKRNPVKWFLEMVDINIRLFFKIEPVLLLLAVGFGAVFGFLVTFSRSPRRLRVYVNPDNKDLSNSLKEEP
jgi:hypothetical protein